MVPERSEIEYPKSKIRSALLVLALAWSAVVRVPIILNAPTHLDSDLAVDGLAAGALSRGQWHWHFPGTPHIGIASALFAAPQMRIWGPTPSALSSSGTVEYAALVVAIFVLASTAFGRAVGCWSLLPLAFASTGMIWLSGRLNSGHLLAAIWHAGAILLVYRLVQRPTWPRAALWGFWCGLGLWHDWMFVMSIVALVPVLAVAWWRSGRWAGGAICALAAAAGCVLGDLPREVGNRLEPYDAYREQMAPIFQGDVLADHARILCAQCLPRLIAGHLLPDFRTEPAPAALGGSPSRGRPARTEAGPLAWATTVLALALFLAAICALARDRTPSRDPARLAARWAILLSSGAIVTGFVLNRNIFNSDNYRYLIYLFVLWPIGLGLALDRLARRGAGGATAAAALALALAVLVTLDTAAWYRRLGWIDQAWQPVRVPLRDPLLAWLIDHPDVHALYGDYWDVYRIEFLTQGRVQGQPYPIFPNRYPQRARAWPGGRPRVLVVRPTRAGQLFLQQAVADGAHALYRSPELAVYDWPAGPARPAGR